MTSESIVRNGIRGSAGSGDQRLLNLELDNDDTWLLNELTAPLTPAKLDMPMHYGMLEMLRLPPNSLSTRPSSCHGLGSAFATLINTFV